MWVISRRKHLWALQCWIPKDWIQSLGIRFLGIRLKVLEENHPGVAARGISISQWRKVWRCYSSVWKIPRCATGGSRWRSFGYGCHDGKYHKCLWRSKKIRRGEEIYHKALGIERNALEEDHSSVATAYKYVSAVLREQGLLEEAIEIQDKALGICQRTVGDDHPDTAQTIEEKTL